MAALYYARVFNDLPTGSVKLKEKSDLIRTIQHHYSRALEEGSQNPDLQNLKSILEKADSLVSR